jgi:hypothetical protein
MSLSLATEGALCQADGALSLATEGMICAGGAIRVVCNREVVVAFDDPSIVISRDDAQRVVMQDDPLIVIATGTVCP